jgi:redox-sensitive bicupin YhaK (pirin superfamily)
MTTADDAMSAKPLRIRRADERGLADFGWLRSRHTFSFADYDDPQWRGFRNLRVINDDRVAPGGGFPMHPHRDMEIVSYVLEGALEHKDSMANGSIIRPGEVQRMSAGTGVLHSEFNPSKSEPVHFLQIWLLPTARGLTPGYEQKTFSAAQKRGRLTLVASPDGRDGSVTIHADALLYATVLQRGDRVGFALGPGRHAWIHVASGSATVSGEHLVGGDAAYTGEPGTIAIEGNEPGEVLAFDLP